MGVQLTGEARSWRRLAVAAAGTVALLTWRQLRLHVATEKSWQFARDYFSGKLPLVDDDELAEPWDQEIVRRLGACEAHLVDLEERLFGIPRPRGATDG